MSILYSLIGRGDVVLTEHAAATGNFVLVTRELIQRIDPYTDRKMSYSYNDRIHYHILVEGGLIYLCMADSGFAKRRAYAYLLDVKGLFLTKYGDQWQNAIALQFDGQFSRTLKQRSDYFSHDPSSDKISAIKSEVEAAKNVVIENIDKLIEREEMIQLTVEKTEALAEESFTFKDKARVMKRKFWWKNVKLWIILGAIVFLIIFFIIWFACGFPAFQKCGSSSPPSSE
eukprot:TRINITY_DN2809_c0_g1_i1.p1 TRINITY_DN2809_c0_g1~~TRINITY_DN2809_c0_g1_i1.p1  ORF type:complete len:240 (-),score=66.94 TRINITY_DN2809_c0_g1_i1:218-904(-)